MWMCSTTSTTRTTGILSTSPSDGSLLEFDLSMISAITPIDLSLENIGSTKIISKQNKRLSLLTKFSNRKLLSSLTLTSNNMTKASSITPRQEKSIHRGTLRSWPRSKTGLELVWWRPSKLSSSRIRASWRVNLERAKGQRGMIRLVSLILIQSSRRRMRSSRWALNMI